MFIGQKTLRKGAGRGRVIIYVGNEENQG